MSPQCKSGRSRAARRSAQHERCGAAVPARRCKNRSSAPDVPTPAKLPARANAVNEMPTLPAAVPRSAVGEVLAIERRRRSVSFDLEAGTEHEITPYAEIYGIHPSEFLFAGQGFVMLLADSDVGCFSPHAGGDAEEDWDEDEECEYEDMEEDASEDNWVVVHCG